MPPPHERILHCRPTEFPQAGAPQRCATLAAASGLQGAGHMEQHEYEAMARLELKLWWYRALHAKVLCTLRRRLPGGPTTALLDAGCGTGGPLSILHARFPDWSLHGIDSSETAVHCARQASPADIRRGSVTELP